jgi:hypothetical protein
MKELIIGLLSSVALATAAAGTTVVHKTIPGRETALLPDGRPLPLRIVPKEGKLTPEQLSRWQPHPLSPDQGVPEFSEDTPGGRPEGAAQTKP